MTGWRPLASPFGWSQWTSSAPPPGGWSTAGLLVALVLVGWSVKAGLEHDRGRTMALLVVSGTALVVTSLSQAADRPTIESHSISAGLDYPGVGPEHSYLADIGRVSYEPITDTEAMEAFRLLCRTEGIIPAVESAHALAGAIKVGQRLAAEVNAAGDDRILIAFLHFVARARTYTFSRGWRSTSTANVQRMKNW